MYCTVTLNVCCEDSLSGGGVKVVAEGCKLKPCGVGAVGLESIEATFSKLAGARGVRIESGKR